VKKVHSFVIAVCDTGLSDEGCRPKEEYGTKTGKSQFLALFIIQIAKKGLSSAQAERFLVKRCRLAYA
jgi:hypothetical protein